MALDLQSLLYAPLYGTWGVPATLTIDDTAYPVTVIDQTVGLPLAGIAELETVRPVAAVMVSQLAGLGIALTELDGETVTFNGNTWTINAWRLKPSANGESDGEVYLVLEGATEE